MVFCLVKAEPLVRLLSLFSFRLRVVSIDSVGEAAS
jgi:hypothetical protein